MLIYRVLSSIFIVYVITALGDERTSLPKLEEIIILKLKTAAQLRENLWKVLSYLPIKDYEMYNSIKIIRKYLRDGGSLVNSLEVLPSIAYLPIREQINEILRTMENYLPRYVLPAIGVIRSAINGRRRALDVEEIFRPNYGPLKADLLYKIHAVDLSIIADTKSLRSTLEAADEQTEFAKETWAMIQSGNIKPSDELIAQILDNIKVNSENPEVRESLKHLVDVLSNSENELNNLTITEDPYETVKNGVTLIGKLEKDYRTSESAQILLPHLKKPEEYCTQNTQLERFFVVGLLNYTLLLSQEVSLKHSESGKTLLAMIERGDINMIEAFEEFHFMEYTKPIDLLIASISHLRRYQRSQGSYSDVLENVYAVLMKKYRPDDWSKYPLRNADKTKTALRAMISENSSLRIRRLVNDIVTTIDTVTTEAWRESRAFISTSECYGPSCAVLQILRALNESRGIKDPSLEASITELLTTWQEEIDYEAHQCVESLPEESSSLQTAPFRLEETRSLSNVTINATDLFQAVRGLTPGTLDYSLLQEFIEDQTNLEKQLGEIIDFQAHPTRGRLLAWLLQKITSSENVEERIKNLADKYVDVVSQEGYGAAGIEESAQQLSISF